LTPLSRVTTKLAQQGDLIGSVAISTLNVVVVASKAWSRVPPVFGRGAGAALGVVGVVSLPIQVRYLIKSGKDVKTAAALGDVSAMVMTAAKVVNEASNIILTTAGFAAVSAALICPAWAAVIWGALVTPAVAATFLAVGLDVHQLFAIRWLNGRLKTIGPDELSGRLKAAAMRVMDPDTQKAIEKSSIAEDKVFQQIITYCRRQEDIATANLVLRYFGYLAMGLCRAYPDTLLQSGIHTSFSLLYTAKLAYSKAHERKTQLAIPQIEVSS